ncbi:hypothetical protein ALP96_200105 [Pseudomonas savastanoi pv. glycinea]|nr:hypothetical protein ALP96_200105 [Pseudomonas savastanoi pv. glycinea]
MKDESYYLPHFETTLGSYAPHFLRITVERLYDGLERGQRSPNEFRGYEIAAFFSRVHSSSSKRLNNCRNI